MTKQTMLELAERCEAATGPDRELDAAILKVVEGVNAYPSIRDWEYMKGGKTRKLPAFTASLDAAMTLVPDDSGMSFAKSVNKAGGWSVALYDENVMARGATRALALCAAALRASGGKP